MRSIRRSTSGLFDSARDARGSIRGGGTHSAAWMTSQRARRAGERSAPVPDYHVLFDQGAITVNDNFSLQGAAGKLRLHPSTSSACSTFGTTGTTTAAR